MADTLDFGPNARRFMTGGTRSLTSDGLGSIRYPSPFFDIAHTYLPSSFKTMLRWCRYYFLTNPLINAVCYKMAEYPVTDLVFDSENESLRKKWEALFQNVLHFKKFEVECGLDYNAYGNCFISIYYPFIKYLVCTSCKNAVRADRQKYKFQEYKFHGECRKCGHYGAFKTHDHYIRSVQDIRLIRWNPEQISVQHNEATGESQYYYTIPSTLANDIRLGKREVIEKTPQVFVDALRLNKSLLFNKDNIYHMKRPTIAQKDKGWGLPMILPVLKDTFYLQVLRKAQEAIAIEHIVPLRIIFPNTASPSADVYCVSLDSWVETRNGPRRARDVQAGDFMKSRQGGWEKVDAVKDRPLGSGESAYEFTIAGLPAFPFTVSEEHPIWGARNKTKYQGYEGVGEPGWINAEDLDEGDFVLYPVRRKKWKRLTLDLAEFITSRTATTKYIYRRLNKGAAEIYEFLEKEGVPAFVHGELQTFLAVHGWTEEDYRNARQQFKYEGKVDRISRFLPVTKDLAYLIGVYAAEGYPSDGGPRFALHAKERTIRDELERIAQDLGFRAEETSVYFNDGNDAQFAIQDVLLGEFLSSACGHGAENKKLPRFILEAPSKIAMSAIRGLFVGDGTNFKTETRRIGLQTVSPDLVVGSRTILLSEGYIPTAQVRVPNEGEIAKLPAYQLNVNGAQADALAKQFGWDQLGWEPGHNKVWSQCGFIRDGFVYLRVNKKEKTTVDLVRGFQMAGDKTFCVVGVATHNTTVNMTNWRQKIEQELIRWRLDNNYIPVMPLPVGQQTLGGEGRALMLAQEYRVWAEHIVAGMGVPSEFVFGGLSYSGSNVSMRILENHFLDYKSYNHALVRDFLMPRIGAFMGWQPISTRFTKFKMADDLQRSAFNLQLNQAGKLSDKSLLEESGWDSTVEMDRIQLEQQRALELQRSSTVAQAAIQGEAQLVGQKYQLRAQKAMEQQMANSQAAQQQDPNQQQGQQDPSQQMQSPLNADQRMGGDPGAVPPAGIIDIAERVARMLDQKPEAERQSHLVRLRQGNPQLYAMVSQMLNARAGSHTNSAAMPMPGMRSPRRGPEAVAA